MGGGDRATQDRGVAKLSLSRRVVYARVQANGVATFEAPVVAFRNVAAQCEEDERTFQTWQSVC